MGTMILSGEGKVDRSATAADPRLQEILKLQLIVKGNCEMSGDDDFLIAACSCLFCKLTPTEHLTRIHTH